MIIHDTVVFAPFDATSPFPHESMPVVRLECFPAQTITIVHAEDGGVTLRATEAVEMWANLLADWIGPFTPHGVTIRRA